MSEDGIVDCRTGSLILEDKIFVRDRVLIFEPHDRASTVGSFNVGLVCCRLERLDLQAGVEGEIDRDIVTGPFSVNAAWGFSGWIHCPGVVTWTDNHWKRPLVRTVFILQSLNVADDDPDLLTGHDVGDSLSEDVWTFLIE